MKRAVAALFGVVVIVLSSMAAAIRAEAGESIYSSITVDLAPIKATGLGEFANPIGSAVKRALSKVYAGKLNPNDKSLPALVVEVDTIYYGQEEEEFISKRMFPNLIRTRDQMSGHAVVRNGKAELKRVSVLGNNTTPGGWPPIDDVKSGRLQALANQFAEAVRYELDD